MTFNVYYSKLKTFDNKAKRFVTSDGLPLIDECESIERKEADAVGFALLGIGISKITKDKTALVVNSHVAPTSTFASNPDLDFFL